MNPRVKSVKPLPGCKLAIQFNNGESGVFNCQPMLSIPVYEILKNPAYFNEASVEYGTVVWPNDLDICPDTLYLDSIKSI